jgi:hypothetical protein
LNPQNNREGYRVANNWGGKRPGAGRKPHSIEVYRRKMEALLCARVTDEDWTKIVDVAVAQAKRGDVAARVWLSERVMGRVTDKSQVETTGMVRVLVEYHRTPPAAGAASGPGADQA